MESTQSPKCRLTAGTSAGSTIRTLPRREPSTPAGEVSSRKSTSLIRLLWDFASGGRKHRSPATPPAGSNVEALEDAGQVMEDVAGTRVGVFMGISTNDYSRLRGDRMMTISSGLPATHPALRLTGFRMSSISWDRALPLDTACSSSLVAVHLACRSLWNRESVLAVAGG